MNRYQITCPGLPAVQRDEISTDTVLRAMFGDTAETTQRMMLLADGSLPEVTGTLRGRAITVKRAQS
jgi:hypothetical protein